MLLEHVFDPAVPAVTGYSRARDYLTRCGFTCRDDGPHLAAEMRGSLDGRFIPFCSQSVRFGLEGGRYCLAYSLEEKRPGTIGRVSARRRSSCRKWMLAQALAVEKAVNEDVWDAAQIDIIDSLLQRRRQARIVAFMAAIALALAVLALLLMKSSIL